MANEKMSFPMDIVLKSNPLIEAWLEIKWHLDESNGFKVDRGYRFALGNFYNLIKNDFPFIEKLPSSQAPEDLIPNIIQFRFRPEDSKYPLFQIGPGIAAVNFTDNYNWIDFKPFALKLCESLVNAYGDNDLESSSFTLIYRNALDYQVNDHLIDILKTKLNLGLNFPEQIFHVNDKDLDLTNLNLKFTFSTGYPDTEAILKFFTATRNENNIVDSQEKSTSIVWQLEYRTTKNAVPALDNNSAIEKWLIDAHYVLYQWFFHIIDGELLTYYKGE